MAAVFVSGWFSCRFQKVWREEFLAARGGSEYDGRVLVNASIRFGTILAAGALAALPARADDVIIFERDGVAILAAVRDGISEPAIPLFVNDVRVDDLTTPSVDVFNVVEGYVRLDGTETFPLAWADIFANGYSRPVILNGTGGSSSFGTSVVTGPSFRPLGEPLDTVPEMLRGNAQWIAGLPVTVNSTGSYGGRALFTSTRYYARPTAGQTQFDIAYTWRATQAIELEPGPSGRGNDAFRLMFLSSMLADAEAGLYDARFLGVNSGVSTTIEVDDSQRGKHLFTRPMPFALGGSITLFKDNRAVWNPGGPSVRVRLLSLTGISGQLGVQGYLADSTNPNDDSLNVWIEWMDAPAVIPGGTQFQAVFRVTANPPTPLGDIDHNGLLERRDAVLLLGLLGRRAGQLGFDAYADIDADGVIACVDYEELVQRMPFAPADLDQNGVLEAPDFFTYLDWFVAGDAQADLNLSGQIDAADFFLYLDLFEGC